MKLFTTVLIILLVSEYNYGQKVNVLRKDYIVSSADGKTKHHILESYDYNGLSAIVLANQLAWGMIDYNYKVKINVSDDQQFTFRNMHLKSLFCGTKSSQKAINIKDSLYFFNTIFQSALMNSYTFEGVVNMNECQFIDDSPFNNSTFEQEAFFQISSFKAKKSEKFQHIKFKKYTSFYASSFIRGAYFSNVTLDSTANFRQTHFYNKCVLSEVTSKGLIDFYYAFFQDTLLINGSYQDLSFNGATLKKYTSFFNSNLNGRVDFQNTQVPRVLDFRSINFDSQNQSNKTLVDLRSARLDSLRKQEGDPDIKCVLWVDQTDINRFIIPYDRFSIVFSDSIPYESKYNAFESLVNSSREAGMIESVEGWDVKFRKLQNSHKHRFLGGIINFINEYWWNFGYDRWLILVMWLPLFFTCFFLLNLRFIKYLWDKVYKDPELGSNFKNRDGKPLEPNFKNFKNRLSFTFFYTAVIYFGFKIRHESVNYNNILGLTYLYLMYGIGTIHMAFAFSYILSAY